jgi:hypothetical protein
MESEGVQFSNAFTGANRAQGSVAENWLTETSGSTLRCEAPAPKPPKETETDGAIADALARLSTAMPEVEAQMQALEFSVQMTDRLAAAVEAEGSRTAVDQNIDRMTEALAEAILSELAPEFSEANVEFEAERDQRAVFALREIEAQDQADAREMDDAISPRTSAPRCEGRVDDTAIP